MKNNHGVNFSSHCYNKIRTGNKKATWWCDLCAPWTEWLIDNIDSIMRDLTRLFEAWFVYCFGYHHTLMNIWTCLFTLWNIEMKFIITSMPKENNYEKLQIMLKENEFNLIHESNMSPTSFGMIFNRYIS